MKNYLGIKIDEKKNTLLTPFSQTLLEEYYCKPGESPQKAFARAATGYSHDDLELAQRIYNYASNQWFMFASPVLSNAPLPGEKVKGLPISCFLAFVPDNLEGLISHTTELRWLAVKGGGVGGHWSNVRSISDVAPGPIPFLHTIDADMLAYKQGKTRKGSYASYLDISHPDIEEFLSIRTPTGDEGRKAQNIHIAVNLTDKFMNAVKNNEDWNLLDPNDKTVRETKKARELWELILETRYRTGEPYLNFIDTANKALPKELKDKGLKIHGSNLCNEIHLPTSEDRTAVCCLSSLNLEKYDEWKSSSLVADVIQFLDNVLTFFINNAPNSIERAKFSAMSERSLGLGAMGYHSYLQQHQIAFDSPEAVIINEEIFKNIKQQATNETLRLGKLKGEAPDMAGTGKRNSHLLAIAPNSNSSIILGCSPSIEPWKANAYTHRTRIGSHLVKNIYLEKELEKIGKNNDEVWNSIITTNGSVQHLNFLPDKLKNIFKTAIEINQEAVVNQAGQRQKHICQGQSVNLFFPAGAQKKDLHNVHYKAWQEGCKGLYYLRTETSNRAENLSSDVNTAKLKTYTKQEKELCSIFNKDECAACQG